MQSQINVDGLVITEFIKLYFYIYKTYPCKNILTKDAILSTMHN